MPCERKSRRISAPQLGVLLVAAAIWILPAASARADEPLVIAFGAHASGPETELVSGEIDPGGKSTEYRVQYGLASSDWCKYQSDYGGGQLGPQLPSLLAGGGGSYDQQHPARENSAPENAKPPHTTEAQTLPYTDYEYHPVSVEISGLAPGSEYCAQLVANNSSGGGSGGKLVFTAGAPSVIHSQFAPASDALQAEVDPAGQATTYQLLYAPIASEWCVSFGSLGTPAKLGAPTPLGYSDGSFHPVSVQLLGLIAGAEYCAALSAENGSGSALGFQITFAEGPAVESVTPDAGPTGGGSVVTIRGENLGDAQAVHFGSASASIQSDAPDKLVVSTPADEAGQVDVTVTTPVGTSATSAADRYTFEAAAGGGSQGGGSSGSGPDNTPNGGGATNTGAGPTLGESTEVGVIGGTVTVHTPGAGSFVPFQGGTIPDGSEVDATHGVVIVTVKTPDGKTASAEVSGGRFLIRQDKDGETHFILTLALTGCRRIKLPHGAAAARVQGRLKKGPKVRYLWVSEKGGRWGTNGRFVSTSVEGTKWLTLDECSRSVVRVTEGRVKVRNLVTHRSRTLGAGGRYEARARRPKHKRHG